MPATKNSPEGEFFDLSLFKFALHEDLFMDDCSFASCIYTVDVHIIIVDDQVGVPSRSDCSLDALHVDEQSRCCREKFESFLQRNILFLDKYLEQLMQ